MNFHICFGVSRNFVIGVVTGWVAYGVAKNRAKIADKAKRQWDEASADTPKTEYTEPTAS